VKTRCRAKPGCSPPGCLRRRRLLIIVDSSVNQLSCVRRSICTSWRIRSHASVKEMSEGECPGECPFPWGAMSVLPMYWCCQQKSSRSRSTSCITLTTVERVVDKCTKFITHWSLSLTRSSAIVERCALSVVILPITTQQCRNYLYDKS